MAHSAPAHPVYAAHRLVLRVPANHHCRGTLLIKHAHPHYDHRRAQGIALPQGPRWGLFLMSEVPLYSASCLHARTSISCWAMAHSAPAHPVYAAHLRVLHSDTVHSFEYSL